MAFEISSDLKIYPALTQSFSISFRITSLVSLLLPLRKGCFSCIMVREEGFIISWKKATEGKMATVRAFN